MSDDGYVMLLVDDFFTTFTTKELADTTTHNEAIFALSAERRGDEPWPLLH